MSQPEHHHHQALPEENLFNHQETSHQPPFKDLRHYHHEELAPAPLVSVLLTADGQQAQVGITCLVQGHRLLFIQKQAVPVRPQDELPHPQVAERVFAATLKAAQAVIPGVYGLLLHSHPNIFTHHGPTTANHFTPQLSVAKLGAEYQLATLSKNQTRQETLVTQLQDLGSDNHAIYHGPHLYGSRDWLSEVLKKYVITGGADAAVYDLDHHRYYSDLTPFGMQLNQLPTVMTLPRLKLVAPGQAHHPWELEPDLSNKSFIHAAAVDQVRQTLAHTAKNSVAATQKLLSRSQAELTQTQFGVEDRVIAQALLSATADQPEKPDTTYFAFKK